MAHEESRADLRALADTAGQVGEVVGLAALTTTDGYGLVFLMASGLGLAIAVTGLPLPRYRHSQVSFAILAIVSVTIVL
ncbi:hypothetical protein AB0395_43125 [Streptosporangium sp. NPDC051023]|uniref:hypothetical protein n=1 Tax=Streptosporangium sp. NPDC051023 TaxID=3155410 RepID=UPI00344BBC49